VRPDTTGLLVGGGGSSGGRDLGGGGYVLGFQPAFRVYVNGKRLMTQLRQGGVQAVRGYDAAIRRVEVNLGIDQVHMATITIIGEESAKLVGAEFEKTMPVRVEVGYEDRPSSFQEVFSGYIMQAYPAGTNPVAVDVECDSQMFQARETRTSATGTEAAQVLYIADTLLQQRFPISANVEDVAQGEADEGGESDNNLLDYIQRWSKANFVHWLDQMNGEVHFFYPGAKPQLGREYRTWTLSTRRTQLGDTNPPILTTWTPRQSFVESPATIEATWVAPEEGLDLKSVVVSATNPMGVEGTSLHIGFLSTATQQDAQDIVDRAAGDYYWASIEGDFALLTGLPILPLDEIKALNPPPGLEDLYATPMEIVSVTHIIDESGWQTKGALRGGRGAEAPA